MDKKGELSRITVDIPKIDHTRLKALSAILDKSMREIITESIKTTLRIMVIQNKDTLLAITNIEEGKNLEEAESPEDLFKKLGI